MNGQITLGYTNLYDRSIVRDPMGGGAGEVKD